MNTKKDFNFYECLENGKQGEIDIMDKLQEMFGETHIIKDVSKIKSYQEKDVDLIMIDKETKKEILIENKTDFTDYDNLFLEKISCEELNTPGWIYKTCADYILYYFKNKKVAYIVLPWLAYALATSDNYRDGRAYDKLLINGKEVRKTSVGSLVPIDDLLRNTSFKDDEIFKEKCIYM